MDNVFYIPSKARWEYLNVHSKDSNIGQIIDDRRLHAHNPKVVSSSLTPATKDFIRVARDCGSLIF